MKNKCKEITLLRTKLRGQFCFSFLYNTETKLHNRLWSNNTFFHSRRNINERIAIDVHKKIKNKI
jgi:hypothetical protein